MRTLTIAVVALMALTATLQPKWAAAEADVADDDYADSFRAQLLFAKTLEQQPGDQMAYPLIVQGRNITIKLTLYNVGTGPAADVVITDELPPNAALVGGSLTATFPKIASGSSVQHSYSLIFTSGGSTDASFLPPASVQYKAEEGGDSQTGWSTAPGFFLLTPVQQIFRYLLIVGSYASLGICRTPTEWRNMAVVLGVVGVVLGVNWGVKTARSSSTTTKRKRALRELEKEE